MDDSINKDKVAYDLALIYANSQIDQINKIYQNNSDALKPLTELAKEFNFAYDFLKNKILSELENNHID